MRSKVAVVLATLVVAVSVATQQKEEASDEGAFGWPKDVIGVILSFFGPMEWSQLGKVGPLWTEAIPNGIAEYLRSHGTPVNTKEYKIIICSEKRKMEDVLKSVMDKPEFRGAIFNKDECTLINHSLRGSQVCSEKGFDGRVKITGVADIYGCHMHQKSKCNGYFIHYTYHANLNARNIRTGKDISIGKIDCSAQSLMVNRKQLVIVQKGELLLYELNWDANTAECVLRETKKGMHEYRSMVLTDESGVVSSVLCRTDNGYYDFNIESKQWKMIAETEERETKISPDGKIVFRSGNGINIETTDGETTLLKVPGVSHFYPSPDGQFVGFEISSQLCIMNLRSGEITVISRLTQRFNWSWTSGNLFQMRSFDGSASLRCAHNPFLNLVTLNEDDSLIEQVKVDDELDASDLFFHFRRAGPDLYHSIDGERVIQVEWMGNHQH